MRPRLLPRPPGVRLFILDLRSRLKGPRPPPSPPTIQLKLKPGEETSLIEGRQAEVPGRPPLPLSLLWPRRNLGRAIWAAEKFGRALFWHGKNHAHVRILEI